MADPRVFVSSVIEGFEVYREAAREGIKAGGETRTQKITVVR